MFDNLDYSFTVGHEDGTAQFDAPGGGGRILQQQLAILKNFMDGLDFVKMRPHDSVIKGGVPDKATARALVEPGRAYAIYVNGGSAANLLVRLPGGKYRAEWVNTKTGKVDKKGTFQHKGGARVVQSPRYSDDMALRILRRGKPD